jgi:hypothetical protein
MPEQVRGEALVGARIIDPYDFGTPGAGPFPGEVEYFMSGQERPYSVKFDPPDNGTLSYSLHELSEVLEHEDSRATAAALAVAWAQEEPDQQDEATSDRRATLTGSMALEGDDEDEWEDNDNARQAADEAAAEEFDANGFQQATSVTSLRKAVELIMAPNPRMGAKKTITAVHERYPELGATHNQIRAMHKAVKSGAAVPEPIQAGSADASDPDERDDEFQLPPRLAPGTVYYVASGNCVMLEPPEVLEKVTTAWKDDGDDDTVASMDAANAARRAAAEAAAEELDEDGFPVLMSSSTAIVPPKDKAFSSAGAGMAAQEKSEAQLSTHPHDDAHLAKLKGVMTRAAKFIRLLAINGDQRIWTIKSQPLWQAFLREKFPEAHAYFHDNPPCDPPAFAEEFARLSRSEVIAAMATINPELSVMLFDLYAEPYVGTDIVFDDSGTASTQVVVIEALMTSTITLHGDNWAKFNARQTCRSLHHFSHAMIQHSCPEQAVWTDGKYELPDHAPGALPETQEVAWRMLLQRKINHIRLSPSHMANEKNDQGGLLLPEDVVAAAKKVCLAVPPLPPPHTAACAGTAATHPQPLPSPVYYTDYMYVHACARCVLMLG